MKKRDNTKKTRAANVKRESNGKWVKGTPSPNPSGAPKRGDSWAETIKAIGEMDGPSIAALWDTQHKEFAHLPEGITMKQLVVMTVYAALLREPSPGNWRELMERADGKVKEEPISGAITINVHYADVTAPASSAGDDQDAG